MAVAVPGRIYIGVFVFSLIAALTIVPLTIMILTGYEAPPTVPLSDPSEYTTGDKAAFVMASLTCILLAGASWRLLMEGARRRRELLERRRHGDSAVEVGGDGGSSPARPKGRDEPPGYG